MQNLYFILLFSCSVSTSAYLELVPKLTASEFIRSGRPKILYSENLKHSKKGLNGYKKSIRTKNSITI